MDVERIIQALADHMQHPLEPDEIDVVPDLEIIDLYAVRVAGASDYIVHAGNGRVEEASFVLWPPAQRGARASASGNRTREKSMRIEQVMSKDVQFCEPDDSLDAAARLMWDNDCGCAPVCSSNGVPHVVGMLTDRDICMAALFGGRSLGDLVVADAMSRDVHICRAGDSPEAVERLMRERQIRRVPVTDASGRLVGIVSLADLARAGKRSTSDITAREIGETLGAICEPPGVVSH